MDYDLATTFYVIMLVTATAGTGVAFFSRKSYDVATCCYGIAMLFSMCFAMLDWFVPEKVGATSLSTTLDTYIMLVMMGMTFLCYKYDMRWKEWLACKIEAARQENIKQRNALLGGIGVVDIADGDVLTLSVIARNSERTLGQPYTGFSAEAVGVNLFRLIFDLNVRGIDITDEREWINTLYVKDKEDNLKETYTFADGVWTKD